MGANLQEFDKNVKYALMYLSRLNINAMNEIKKVV